MTIRCPIHHRTRDRDDDDHRVREQSQHRDDRQNRGDRHDGQRSYHDSRDRGKGRYNPDDSSVPSDSRMRIPMKAGWDEDSWPTKYYALSAKAKRLVDQKFDELTEQGRLALPDGQATSEAAQVQAAYNKMSASLRQHLEPPTGKTTVAEFAAQVNVRKNQWFELYKRRSSRVSDSKQREASST
ncbi:fatty acid synthase subunit alpha [Penicillium verhagenii]|uniref:fatty acid synthase subunit alpha n=1 Tax=Penicillium verhagenii TaxID=1562060 RepID=UPI0025453172|nr:fatty acid synthase subunit alpha [Penicillium verhagenii]KAJ5915399.1 fatty acid synthase subunit alpha [Penicillium verhagenii]